MSDITARSIVTLVIFFVINALVIWPIKIPIPRAAGLAYRRLLDGLSAALGFGPLDEQPVWRGNSDGTRQDALPETAAAPPDAPPSSTAVASAAAASSADAALEPAAGEDKRVPRHFKLGLVTAPPAGVLLLLASTCITGRTVREGIVAEPIRPFDVMILFLSFAYIALSLDQVGLLRYLAFLVAKKATENAPETDTPAETPAAPTPAGSRIPTPPPPAHVREPPIEVDQQHVLSGGGEVRARGGKKGKSAQPVFAALYALFIFISALAGNDPIVLSGTPFVAYFSRSSASPPEPYAFMELYSANLASAILVSSNPTNLVLSAAFGLSFLAYSAWMVLPTLAAALALYPVLAIQWRKELRKSIRPPDVDPRSALVDPAGAVWASTVFLLAIVVLVVLSATGQLEGAAGVWSVAAPAALLVAARDMWHDWRHRARSKKDDGAVEMDTLAGREAEKDAGDEDYELHLVSPAMRPGMRRRLSSKAGPMPAAVAATASQPASAATSAAASSATTAAPPRRKRPRHPVHAFRATFPTVARIVPRLPFPLVLFALSFFVLVRSLESWVSIWARWWAVYVAHTGLAGAIFLMALLSVVGSNVVGTNIGMTVLWSACLGRWWQDHEAGRPGGGNQRLLMGSILTLAAGANYGAFSFTFSASLAGLLWKDLLFARGIRVKIGRFCYNNLVPLTVTMVVSCLVIAAEVCVMY